jgi:hypothetical protein
MKEAMEELKRQREKKKGRWSYRIVVTGTKVVVASAVARASSALAACSLLARALNDQ